MSEVLLIAAIVIIICVLINKISVKLGIPVLLLFIALGMFFGSDGAIKIPFENYAFAEQICSTALIFIMFYGGFGTKWNEARPVAAKSILLSTLGVLLTAGITGLFCHYVLGLRLLESLLLGAVVSSTDAASVFSILRSKKLNLKYRTASLLEVESGSNDPTAYMLTVLVLTFMKGTADPGAIVYMIFAQVVYGIFSGVAIAFAALLILRRFKFSVAGFDTAFVLAIAVLAYAAPSAVGGNGYLSAYIAGIMLGNSKFKNKTALVNFFDGLTGLMQMLIFFLLGLLSFPSRLPSVLLPSLAIAGFLTFVARPVAVFALLGPFGSKLRQMLLVSWSGLRGAASIVFVIMAAISGISTENDVFHMVFCIVLLSIALQGSLIPLFARKLNMVDNSGNVLKTFNDYANEVEIQFVKLAVDSGHPWRDKRIRNIPLPPDMLAVSLIREKKALIPKGATRIHTGDILVLGAPAFQDDTPVELTEISIDENSAQRNRRICDLRHDSDALIVLIKRGGRCIIPSGKTVIRQGDVLVVSSGS